MRVAICDDDISHSGMLEGYLLDISKKYQNLNVDIDVYQSGEELLRMIEIEKQVPQILFLDVEMGDLNGIETAYKLRSSHKKMHIIYVSSYSQYTCEGYEVGAFRYILKPISYESIEKHFSAAIDEVLNNREWIFFKQGNDDIQIRCEDVVCIMSERGRMLRLITDDPNDEQVFYAKLKDVEKILNPLIFIKVNQGTIINLNYVRIVSSDEVYMKNGNIIPISRSRKKDVKSSYSLFVKRKVGICL